MGFVATKFALEDYSPLWTNSLRFILAAIISLPFLFYKKSWQRETDQLKQSFCAGIFLLTAMLLQTYGLKYTSVAKSSFITTFYAFFVPLLGIMVLGKRYMKGYWGLIGLALIGIAFLCNLEYSAFNIGDALTITCALFHAIHMLCIAHIVRFFKSAIELNLLQCFWVGLLSIPLGTFLEGPPDLNLLISAQESFWVSALWGFVLLGFFSSVIAFSIQSHAQRVIPPHIVGLIFLMESPFAALMGYLLLGEKLTHLALIGCGLVGVAVVLVPKYGQELTPRKEQLFSE